MTGISIALIPFSWALGVKKIRKKGILAIGPFRFCLHTGLPKWSEI